jgi:hypothetical protein
MPVYSNYVQALFIDVFTLVPLKNIEYVTADQLQTAATDVNAKSYVDSYAVTTQNPNGNWQPASPIYFWGQTLTNQCISRWCTTGPAIARPAQEVMDAWNQGWTGKDVNVLIEDSITQQHGAIIVRSKFPNLNASNTASILLDTARYDTLACSKNGGTCDPAIYGKGEASLSRALAPVGKLK